MNIQGSGRRRHKAICATAVALAFLAGACGSDDKKSTDSTPATTVAGAGSTTVGAGGELAAAQALVDQYTPTPTKIGITEPLKGDLKGKKVIFVECSATNCKEHGDLMEEPFKLLGADYQRIPAGGTPEEFAAAYDSAIAMKPDVVLTAGITSEVVSTQLDELESLGIPVISQATGKDPTNGVDKEMLSPAMWQKAGRAAAAWIAVDSKCAANVLYLKETIFTFANPSYEYFESGLKEFCPKAKITRLDVPVTDIGTAIPGQVVSAFQSDPSLNYITNSYGAQAIGVVEALTEAGITGTYRLMNQAGTAYNNQQLLDGAAVVDMQVSENLQAWVMADAAARAVLGQTLDAIDDANLPWFTFLTKDEVTWNVNTEHFEGVAGLADQFKALWGVS